MVRRREEMHYRLRPLDLLRMWQVKVEAWILEQAGIKQRKEEQAGLRQAKTRMMPLAFNSMKAIFCP